MMYNFQKFFIAMRNRCGRNKSVSIKDLDHHLECLGSVKPVYKGGSAGRSCKNLDALSLNEAVDVVT